MFSLCVLCGKRLVPDDRFAHNRCCNQPYFEVDLDYDTCPSSQYTVNNTKLVPRGGIELTSKLSSMNLRPFANIHLQKLVREVQALFRALAGSLAA